MRRSKKQEKRRGKMQEGVINYEKKEEAREKERKDARRCNQLWEEGRNNRKGEERCKKV